MRSLSASLLLCTVLAAEPITAEDASPLRAAELSVCQALVEYECQGKDRTFSSDLETLVFLTRIEGATGEAFVEHVWSLDGKELRRFRLPVKTASYRTWSTKRIKGQPGKWRAEVLDPVGRSVGAVDFLVRAPAGGEKKSP